MQHLVITKAVQEIDHAATGAQMRELRRAAKLSLRAMGEKLGVSAPYLCDLELGRRAWSQERVDQFVAALA